MTVRIIAVERLDIDEVLRKEDGVQLSYDRMASLVATELEPRAKRLLAGR